MDDTEAERIIEAALFMSSRPLTTAELGKLIGVAAPGYVAGKLQAVAEAYDRGGSAIEVVEESGKYYMRLRVQYAAQVKDFASAAEISRHALRTLAYITKSEGITKSALCKKLGSSIYNDVAELLEKGFVTAKKSGRTTSLATTPKFKAYFGQQ